MQSLEKLISLLQSPHFSALTITDKAMLKYLMDDMPVSSYTDLQLALKTKTELAGQSITHASRTRLALFLENMAQLQFLLLEWKKALEAVFSEFKGRYGKTDNMENVITADLLVDVMVVQLSQYGATVIKKAAESLDHVYDFAGISLFASQVANLAIACQYTFSSLPDAKEPSNVNFVKIVLRLISVTEAMRDLKLAVEAYRDFHFEQFVFHSTLNQADSRCGNALLTQHFDKYTLLQEILRVLLHPVVNTEKTLYKVVTILMTARAQLAEMHYPSLNTWSIYLFGILPPLQLTEEKLFKDVFTFVDRYVPLEEVTLVSTQSGNRV